MTFAADAFFDAGASQLRADAKATLASILERTRSIALDSVTVVGHTDTSGNDWLNQRLALQRAESVKAFLVSQGVDADRVFVEGRGASQPVADNRTASGRSKNRRVEIEISGTHAPKRFAVVRVLFATDRLVSTLSANGPSFGPERGTLSYGSVDVSIPRDHRMGELESPSILRFEFRKDPEKHVVVLSTQVMRGESFFAEIANRVKSSSQADALLFVHGYNVSFDDAARRAAQMAYDLSFAGAPVFFSWPSQASTPLYTIDSQNVEWSQSNLHSFLFEFLSQPDLRRAYIIAHSMGTRSVTRALAALLTEHPQLRAKVSEIILAAPDIDAAVFRRDIAPKLAAAGRPITLYASSDDLALAASKRVNGYPRAGDSGAGLIVINGIETVDASAVDTSFIGHSYFAERRSVLSDVFSIVRDGKRAHQRFGLQARESPSGTYWEFRR